MHECSKPTALQECVAMNHPRCHKYPLSLCMFLPLGLLTAGIGCSPSAGGGGGSGGGGAGGDGNENGAMDGTVPPTDGGDQDGDQTDTGLGAAEVVFPDSGDGLIIVTEAEGLGSAVYSGYDDGASIRPMRVVADAGDDFLTINLDVEGRAVQFIFGGATTDLTHQADGIIDITVSDASGVLYTDSDVQVGSAKMAGGAALKFTDGDLVECAESVLFSAALTIDPLGSIPEGCLYLRGGVALGTAKQLCLIKNALRARLEEVLEECPNQPNPGACIDRTQLWLEEMADAQAEAESIVISNVKHFFSVAPACANRVPEQAAREDKDGDGVFDDNDLCLDTPAGEAVTPYGCSDSQFGAINCEDLVKPGEECEDGDGCCELDCLFPNFDPDCSNAIVCAQTFSNGVGMCCEGDGCDSSCPEEDVDCVGGQDNGNDNTDGDVDDDDSDGDDPWAGREGDGFTVIDAVHDFQDLCGSCIQSDGRDLTISWTGCPAYPVTAVFAPLLATQGGCSDDLDCLTQTIQLMKDDLEPENAQFTGSTFVFPKAIKCPQNLESSRFISYELILTDASGFSAALDKVSFQCTVNPVSFTCPCE